jgi:hypothetical protein
MFYAQILAHRLVIVNTAVAGPQGVLVARANAFCLPASVRCRLTGAVQSRAALRVRIASVACGLIALDRRVNRRREAPD